MQFQLLGISLIIYFYANIHISMWTRTKQENSVCAIGRQFIYFLAKQQQNNTQTVNHTSVQWLCDSVWFLTLLYIYIYNYYFNIMRLANSFLFFCLFQWIQLFSFRINWNKKQICLKLFYESCSNEIWIKLKWGHG